MVDREDVQLALYPLVKRAEREGRGTEDGIRAARLVSVPNLSGWTGVQAGYCDCVKIVSVRVTERAHRISIASAAVSSQAYASFSVFPILLCAIYGSSRQQNCRDAPLRDRILCDP